MTRIIADTTTIQTVTNMKKLLIATVITSSLTACGGGSSGSSNIDPLTTPNPSEPTVPVTPLEPSEPDIPMTPLNPPEPIVPLTPLEPLIPIAPSTPIDECKQVIVDGSILDLVVLREYGVPGRDKRKRWGYRYDGNNEVTHRNPKCGPAEKIIYFDPMSVKPEETPLYEKEIYIEHGQHSSEEDRPSYLVYRWGFSEVKIKRMRYLEKKLFLTGDDSGYEYWNRPNDKPSFLFYAIDQRTGEPSLARQVWTKDGEKHRAGKPAMDGVYCVGGGASPRCDFNKIEKHWYDNGVLIKQISETISGPGGYFAKYYHKDGVPAEELFTRDYSEYLEFVEAFDPEYLIWE